MKLELYLSEGAKRERFVAGKRALDEPVCVDVGALELQPHTRALLFDTFGEKCNRIPPDVLRVDRVPRRDWDFYLLAHAFRAKSVRRRWRRRLGFGAWLSLGLVVIALLNSPLLGVAGTALMVFTLYMAIGIFGTMLA